MNECVWSNGVIRLTGINRSTRSKVCPSAALSTWAGLKSIPGQRGESPATSRLSCAALHVVISWDLGLRIMWPLIVFCSALILCVYLSVIRLICVRVSCVEPIVRFSLYPWGTTTSILWANSSWPTALQIAKQSEYTYNLFAAGCRLVFRKINSLFHVQNRSCIYLNVCKPHCRWVFVSSALYWLLVNFL